MKNIAFLFLIVLYWNMSVGQPIIIDHNCSKLEPIPEWAVLQARDSLHIAYGHTSHGSQLTTGMTALANQDTNLIGYKGDIYCWDYYWEPGVFECLDIDDYFRSGDLGHNGDTTWAASTRDYLKNDPYSGDINVIMWSWCGGCSDNTVQGIQIYLDKMNELEQDYPDIHFVYMTGHRDIWSDDTLKRNNQLIRDYCVANNKILFDFADIESYDPDGNYYEYANDNCNYYDENINYLGNWATEWQNSHTEGVDWYNCYAAHSEPLNGNMKAYASWWLFCRLAGWDGSSANQISLDLKLMTEGAFNGTNMNTNLNTSGLIPLSQPFNSSPWNYNGTESVSPIPNSNIVDWVLIELRDATDASLALPGTIIARQAAFLLNDGSIVDTSGTSVPVFNHSLVHSLFVVIRHRNHLGIMSAYPLTESGGIYSYDFTTPAGQAYNSGQKNIGGIYVMYSGDANADGEINDLDKSESWLTETGLPGYLPSDLDMDGQSNNIDKNDVWLQNKGVNSEVPD
ncbi:MAG: hypothetical protein B6D61_14840 [Bacteroidetes bacterium 4484_249]|nr:MAG: hypothetical protein B6D61_14840 [Bacteroidetes bacterium 4484_249]